MSRFTDELKVIPKAARIVAILAYLALATGFALFVLFGHDSGVARTPEAGKLALIVLPGILLAIYALLIGYVYADAKRRGMRYVMWTLLAIFIPDAIGIILYFVLREPPMKACPGCAHLVKPGFTFCPHCGTSLQPTCPNCGRAVEFGWTNCPHCGTKLPSPAPDAA
ncbi:MAG: zinc ribbon domain-containing protein [Candidatus Acidiferrales bacterium]